MSHLNFSVLQTIPKRSPVRYKTNLYDVSENTGKILTVGYAFYIINLVIYMQPKS